MTLRANATDDANLPKAVQFHPSIIPHVAAFNDAQHPFTVPRPGTAASAGEALIYDGELGNWYHVYVVAVR